VIYELTVGEKQQGFVGAKLFADFIERFVAGVSACVFVADVAADTIEEQKCYQHYPEDSGYCENNLFYYEGSHLFPREGKCKPAYRILYSKLYSFLPGYKAVNFTNGLFHR
jgi:hypothetical protein